VPKLIGKKLKVAKRKLKAAGCKVGQIQKTKRPKGKGRRPLVVKSSNPAAGAQSASGKVNLTLGPKPRKARH
jgi:beta-lactam-binding protein with PASTA domain